MARLIANKIRHARKTFYRRPLLLGGMMERTG